MKKFPLIFYLTLLLALALRLYKIPQLFYFNMDEALLAFRGWGIFELGRPFIIGGISPLGFHLPPYFYWLSAFFLLFTGGDPVGWGVAAAGISVITIIFLFLLSQKIFDRRTAIVASILYATSTAAVFFDRHYWPLSLNPLFLILTLYFLLVRTKFSWYFLALVFLFAFSADPSNWPLVIPVAVYIVKEKINFTKIARPLGLFLALFFLPLVVFDLRHQGSNISGVGKFIDNGAVSSFANLINSILLLPRFFAEFIYTPFTNVSFFHTYCPLYASQRLTSGEPILVAFLALLVSLFVIKKIQVKHQEFYLAVVLLAYFLGVVLYGGIFGRPLFEHYLAGLLPLFAYLLARVFTRFWIIGFFLMLIFVNLNLEQFLKAENPYGLDKTYLAIDWVGDQLKDRQFALDSRSKCFRYNGIRYLMEEKGVVPSISFIDPQFFWLYREMPGSFVPDRVVLFDDSGKAPGLPIVAQNRFGAWWVYILDNSSKSYQIEM